MNRYNKATATVLAGSLMAVVSAFVPMDPMLADAIKVIVLAVLVWGVPNVS